VGGTMRNAVNLASWSGNSAYERGERVIPNKHEEFFWLHILSFPAIN